MCKNNNNTSQIHSSCFIGSILLVRCSFCFNPEVFSPHLNAFCRASVEIVQIVRYGVKTVITTDCEIIQNFFWINDHATKKNTSLLPMQPRRILFYFQYNQEEYFSTSNATKKNTFLLQSLSQKVNSTHILNDIC